MAEVDGRFVNHRLRGIWFEFGLSSLWPEFQRKLQKKALIKQPTKIFGRDGFCFSGFIPWICGAFGRNV